MTVCCVGVSGTLNVSSHLSVGNELIGCSPSQTEACLHPSSSDEPRPVSDSGNTEEKVLMVLVT